MPGRQGYCSEADRDQGYCIGGRRADRVVLFDPSAFLQHLRFDQSLSSVVLRNVEIVDYMNEVRETYT